MFSDVAVDSIIGGTAYMSGIAGSSSGIGGFSSPFDEDDDWIWGTVNEGIYPPEGKCDGSMIGISDGSNEIEWHLNNPVSTQEPPFFTNIEIVEVTFWTCWYNEPPQLPRVFSTGNGAHCMENEELTFYYDAALWIIDDYNDVSNDYGSTVNIADGEGARPVGKDFITIEIEDDFRYIDSKFFHRYYISYGIPTVAPTD